MSEIGNKVSYKLFKFRKTVWEKEQRTKKKKNQISVSNCDQKWEGPLPATIALSIQTK